jgi:hypothetical protein
VDRHQDLNARAGQTHILANPVVICNPSAVDDAFFIVPIEVIENVEVSSRHHIERFDTSLPPHHSLDNSVIWDIHPHTDVVPVNEKEAGVQNFSDLKEILRQVKEDIFLSPELRAEKFVNHIVKVRRGRCELSHIPVQSVAFMTL